MLKRILVSATALLFLVTGCSYKSEVKIVNGEAVKSNQLNVKHNKNFQQVSFSVVPNWNTQNFRKSFLIFRKGCESGNIDPRFKNACREIKKYKEYKARDFFENNFAAHVVSQNNGSVKGKVTGYFEAKATGSIIKTDRFRYPVYEKPRSKYDKRKSRASINKYGISSRVLCYIDNRFDLYMLHLQGSGTIYMQNNSTMKVGYSLSNGIPFNGGISVALKREVLKSYQAFNRVTSERWVRRNPAKADYVFNKYGRYIFFGEERRGASIGAIGMELIAGHSIAVDPKKVPLGSPIMLYTYHQGSKSFINRLVFAHDTGKAIKGQIRADLFFGEGQRAKRDALRMNSKGSMIILLPTNKTTRNI